MNTIMDALQPGITSGKCIGINVCMMYHLCRFLDTGWRSAAMVKPLTSSDSVRCEAVSHAYGTRWEGVAPSCECDTPGDFIMLPH